MFDPIRFTREFIDIPSVTGEEAAAAEFCGRQLAALGYEVSSMEVEPNRPNILARLDEPRILLNTHIDTVPPFFPSREEGEWIYGRGACDTKGILASMLLCAERLVAEQVRDVALLLVVGEETDSAGAKHANRHVSLDEVRYTIVGEPTESRYARAQKGGFKFTLTTNGKAAHSGYPEQGRSAIASLLAALSSIETMDWGRDGALGSATANIGVVQGGKRANIVPDAASAEVFVRVVDSVDEVRRRLEKHLVAHPDVRWQEDTSNDPVQLECIEGEPETVVSFNTDIPHLTRFGKPLLMGPGSILDAHSPHERIRKRDIIEAAGLYHGAIAKLKARF